MDHAFGELVNKIVLVYLYDIIIFSKRKNNHFQHLQETFQKYQEFKISLNPKKSIFAMNQGKLLEHLISKYGFSIDPKIVEAISKLTLTSNIKKL